MGSGPVVRRPEATFLHRRDPRATLLLVTGALVAVLSEPREALEPFGPYFLLLAGLLLGARAPLRMLLRRTAAVAPLALAAALLIPMSGGGSTAMALSLLLRALAAVGLLTLLVSTQEMDAILWGMGALGMPRLFTTQSAFMLRYAHLLGEEAVRTERARRSRTPGRLRVGRIRTLGQQAALVFLRGWRRSQTVHQAMLARGFDGTFPTPPRAGMTLADVALAVAGPAAFAAVRLFWPA